MRRERGLGLAMPWPTSLVSLILTHLGAIQRVYIMCNQMAILVHGTTLALVRAFVSLMPRPPAFAIVYPIAIYHKRLGN